MIVVGVGLAAVGAVLGVWAFSDVMKPAELGDADLADFDMGRLSGNPFATYQELKDSTSKVIAGNETAKARMIEAEAIAKQRDAEAIAAEVVATNGSRARQRPDQCHPQGLRGAGQEGRCCGASRRRGQGRRRRRTASAAAPQRESAGGATSAAHGCAASQGGFQGAEGHRQCLVARLRAACIAGVVILLALAPKPKVETPPAQELSLVSIELTDAGRAVLGCEIGSVQAIQIGGTTEAPTVVTMPVDGCASERSIEFPAVTTTSLATSRSSNPSPRNHRRQPDRGTPSPTP